MPLIESTFSFSWWILASNLRFDALISKIENVNLHKKYLKNKFYHCWISPICSYSQICNVQNVVFQVQMWLPHSWNVVFNNTMCDDIIVNTHCDVTMVRLHCLGNYMMQTMGSDVGPVIQTHIVCRSVFQMFSVPLFGYLICCHLYITSKISKLWIISNYLYIFPVKNIVVLIRGRV